MGIQATDSDRANRYYWLAGSAWGTRLEVHYSALTAPVFLATMGIILQLSLRQQVHLLILVVATGACLVAHEWGHVAIAKLLGVHTKTVTLYPIGAVSRLQKEPQTPADDLMIALSGPVVSLLLATTFFLVAHLDGAPIPISIAALNKSNILGQLGTINLAVACVNLIPVLPLDGGRIVRAILGLFLNYQLATKYAMYFSVAVAAVSFAIGFFIDPLFFFIAAFIWYGATREGYSADAKALLRKKTVVEYLASSFKTLDLDVDLQTIFDQVIQHPQKDFPVAKNGVVCNFLSAAQIKKGLQGGRSRTKVADLLRDDFFKLTPDTPVEEALLFLDRHQLQIAPVFDQTEFLGVISKHDVLHGLHDQTVQEEIVHNSSRKLL